MPKEAYYVLIPCLTLVLLYALWKGRGLVIGKSSIEVKASEPRSSVSVGKGLVIEGGAKVGDVAAVIAKNAAVTPLLGDVALLDNARIAGSEVGDIAVIKQEGEVRKE